MTTRFLTAAQAASALGVTKATLYAYASRGLVHSDATPGRVRERRYHREDIERLKERKAVRRDPSRAAVRGLRWGEPVLESRITLIDGGTFYYRGRDAVALSRTVGVEETAALLWETDDTNAASLFASASAASDRALALTSGIRGDVRARMQAALAIGGAADDASHDLRMSGVRATGARIVRLLTRVVTGRSGAERINEALHARWARRMPAARDAIRAALVLSADHELNASTFAARVAASAGASPYDVVSAALATLKGYKHGGASERMLALAAEVDTPVRARRVIGDRLRLGESVPGFGHPLYPGGDPRATELIRLAEAGAVAARWRPFRSLIRAGAELLGEAPNLDFGLAAIARVYSLPDHAPFTLFALGRTLGWIAHAMEEYAGDRLIRPRARYVGTAPGDFSGARSQASG